MAAAGGFAQPAGIAAQETARAHQLLGSAQWLDRAWQVYFGGRLHSQELNNVLVEQFRAAAALGNPTRFSDEYAFVAVLFDAAIEAGLTGAV